MTQTARQTAVAKADDTITANVAKIETAKRPSALQMMAHRLHIDANVLEKTLRATVFAKASPEEFVALMIVAESYRLNPLTKEIYAFPAKGGGIVPIVSIDGWLRIINEHPMFDGLEHNDIPDQNGKLIAVEAVIYRKDRAHPVKIVEYLEECQQNTDPWKKLPARMLRHKATIQCARYAFGFSGVYDEDDGRAIGDVQMGGDLTPEPAPMRSANKVLTANGKRTQEDEETARALDAGFDPQTSEVLTAREDAQHGEQNTGAEINISDWGYRLEQAPIIADVLTVEREFEAAKAQMDGDDARNVQNWIETAKARFGK